MVSSFHTKVIFTLRGLLLVLSIATLLFSLMASHGSSSLSADVRQVLAEHSGDQRLEAEISACVQQGVRRLKSHYLFPLQIVGVLGLIVARLVRGRKEGESQRETSPPRVRPRN